MRCKGLLSLNRPNINNIPPIERQRLAEYLFDYVTQDIMLEHRGFQHGNPQTFIPWHRNFLRRLEQYLGSAASQFVPFPYWNPAEVIPQEFAVVKRFNDGFNYAPLRRLFINMPAPPRFIPPQVCTYYPNLISFAEEFEKWHGTVHTSIGGAMGAIETSPAALIFWCFHGFIDLVSANVEPCW